ncbi:MAG: hypothetical protein Q4F84_09300 [Fibrobacter sp.]|nr:hypothetical protein [Fibrobacter sp.]
MQQLNLELIAARLESFEETIISLLLDRAQYYSNTIIYQVGKSGFSGENEHSLFDIRLRNQENMDSVFGRFCVPEERPFTSNLQPPKRTVTITKNDLHIDDYNMISVTDDILSSYLKLIPKLCRDGDDLQYGSCVEIDVYAIQAIARRIHFGALYVGESKYRSNQQSFISLIEKQDTKTILDLITRKEIEDRIVERIILKTNSVQQTANRLVRHTVDPEIIAGFYRDIIIPLTKKGEILYLMNRNKNQNEF